MAHTQAKAYSTEQLNEEEVCDASDFQEEHKNLLIETVRAEPLVFEKIAPWYGPDGKEYIKILDPDTMKDGPWSIQVLVSRFPKPSLLITVKDVGNTDAAWWESQDHIVADVWWGRIAETEFDIDVKKGEVYIARDINHGPATMPFQDACPDSQKLKKNRP